MNRKQSIKDKQPYQKCYFVHTMHIIIENLQKNYSFNRSEVLSVPWS